MSLIVGLTGLIGSGKTTVAKQFAKLGIPIIDTDIIAHQLTSENSLVLNEISQAFGADLVRDGKLQRELLREKVFADSNLHQQLEQILHPKIFQQALEQLNNLTQHRYVIIVVPLLFRSPHYLSLIHRSLFIDAEYDILLQRVYQRSGLTKSMLDAILAKQVDRLLQLAKADNIIYNNEDQQSLAEQVYQLHQYYSQGI
jgi:dephospho-CoA kinase